MSTQNYDQSDASGPWIDVAEHVYPSRQHKIIRQHHETSVDDRGKPKKRFLQYHIEQSDREVGTGHGHWVRGAPDRFELYVNPSDVRNVIHVEGEACADAVNAAIEAEGITGWVATTSPGGSKAWRNELAAAYKGKHVYGSPDWSEDGYDYIAAVMAAAAEHGAMVRKVIEVEGEKRGDDLKDWLARGNNIADWIGKAPLAGAWTSDWKPSDWKPAPSTIELHWCDPCEDIMNRWLVKGLMPQTGIGLLAARRGAGKTFCAMHIAHTLATGDSLIGKKLTERVGTLWVAREAPGQIPLRMRGLPDEPGSWPFVYIKKCPRLLNTKGKIDDGALKQIIETITAASAEMMARHEARLGFVVIDTMRLVAGYGERGENDPSQTGNVMAALSEVAEATRTFVLGIDHMGKNTKSGTRGGSSKEDDADLVIYLDGEHGDGRLIVEKVRDGPDNWGVQFECVMVDLGFDPDGDPVTTARVEFGDACGGRPSKRLPPMAAKLAGLITDLGGLPRPEAAVRAAFDAMHPGTPDAARMAFVRAVKDLDLVKVGDDLDHADADRM